MATIQVTDSTFEEEVLKSDKPVVLDFWAPWCGPCKQIFQPLEEISDEMSDKITIAKINYFTYVFIAYLFAARYYCCPNLFR